MRFDVSEIFENVGLPLLAVAGLGMLHEAVTKDELYSRFPILRKYNIDVSDFAALGLLAAYMLGDKQTKKKVSPYLLAVGGATQFELGQSAVPFLRETLGINHESSSQGEKTFDKVTKDWVK